MSSLQSFAVSLSQIWRSQTHTRAQKERVKVIIAHWKAGRLTAFKAICRLCDVVLGGELPLLPREERARAVRSDVAYAGPVDLFREWEDNMAAA